MKSHLKLKNNTFDTSLNGFVTSFMMLICCGVIPFAYIIGDQDILKRILDNILATLCLIILIAVICLAFILSAFSFIKGNLKLTKNPIKSIEFDTNGIHVNFKHKILNCTYAYNEISEMTLILHTIKTPHFNTSTYRSGLDLKLGIPISTVLAGAPYQGNVLVKEIEICIIDNNGVNYSINVAKIQLFDTSMHKLLRDLMFFIQFVPNFSYSFNGPEEKIASYILGTDLYDV